MSLSKSKLIALHFVAGLVPALFLAGCGSSATTGITAQAGSAPAVVTVSDAPLGNVLSAKVTISSVAVTTASGTSASLLTKPETIELSGLGSIQEPIELTSLPFGTYNSITVTVSAAQVTYVDPNTGLPVTASATIGTSAVTVALNPALTFSNQDEVHLQIAFNLANSFSITGTAVSFTPAISSSGVQISQNGNGQNENEQVEVSGMVTAISNTSITVQSSDSNMPFTFTINGSTQFPTGVTPATIALNSIVQVQGQLQQDGSMLALSITPLTPENGQGNEDGAKGIVVSVTSNNGILAGFAMVPQQEYGSMPNNATSVNVVIGTSTTYAVGEHAQALGITPSMFNAGEIFPGQAVMVMGTTDANGNLDATQITLGRENLLANLNTIPQTSGANVDFALGLASNSLLTTLDQLSTLNAAAGANTDYGNGLTAASFLTTPVNTSIQVDGYLLVDTNNNHLLTASEIDMPDTPEPPEGN